MFQHSTEMLNMMTESWFGKEDDVVNIDNDILILEDAGHFALENITGDH